MKKDADWKQSLLQFATEEGMELNQSTAEEDKKEEKKPQKFTIKVEKRGAAQKKATIIYGYNGSDDELAEFASDLRKKLSTGGSARGGEMLFQGDVATAATKLLEEMGHKVKRQ